LSACVKEWIQIRRFISGKPTKIVRSSFSEDNIAVLASVLSARDIYFIFGYFESGKRGEKLFFT
jgi:hypothetical protein